MNKGRNLDSEFGFSILIESLYFILLYPVLPITYNLKRTKKRKAGKFSRRCIHIHRLKFSGLTQKFALTAKSVLNILSEW